MRAQLLLLGASLLCCSAEPESCGAADDILSWQIRTNSAVMSVSFPVDGCGHYAEVRAELGTGGRIAVSRQISLNTPAIAELGSGGDSSCAVPFTVQIDAELVPSTSARFPLVTGLHEAGVAAQSSERCDIRIRPRLQLQ